MTNPSNNPRKPQDTARAIEYVYFVAFLSVEPGNLRTVQVELTRNRRIVGLQDIKEVQQWASRVYGLPNPTVTGFALLRREPANEGGAR